MRYATAKRVWPYALTLLILAAGAFWASKTMAAHTVTNAEDVRSTKHNLASNPDIGATGTSEPCVFCHTPHGGTTVGADNSAPLWNRLVPDTTGFTMYSGPNFEASDIGISPRGVSLACLSCHDGTIAFDALVNAPGSGGFQGTNLGTGPGPGTSDPNIGFTALGLVDAADSSFREGNRDATDQDTTVESPFSGGIHDTVTGGLAAEGAEPFPNLSRNLSDDHPISMEVPAANFNGTGGGVDPQFALIGTNSPAPAINGQTVKFITKTAGTMPVDIRDRLRAYPSTATANSYYIECASCHNPHTPRVLFLRLPSSVPGLVTTSLPSGGNDSTGNPDGKTWAQRPNAGSAICLSCHEK